MLKTATSTNILSFNRDKTKTEMINIIPRLKSLGYENLDLNFCEMMNEKSSLLTDDAEKYLTKLNNYKDEIKVNYIQSHVPYTQDYLALDTKGKGKIDNLINKAISYSSFLGIENIVIHPIKGSLKDNLNYFDKLLKDLPSNVKLAIENMDGKDEISNLKTLSALVRELKSDKAGICLDTGHAHLNYDDFSKEIINLYPYLIATHIADNKQEKDEHLLPFFGTIRWENVMKSLKEIGYDGYLTYEVMFFTQNLPLSLKEKIIPLSLEIGSYLSEMAN